MSIEVNVAKEVDEAIKQAKEEYAKKLKTDEESQSDEFDDEEVEEKIIKYVYNEVIKNPQFWKDFMTYFAIPFIQGAFYGLGEHVAHSLADKYGWFKRKQTLPKIKTKTSSTNTLIEEKNKNNNTQSVVRNQPVMVAMSVDNTLFENILVPSLLSKSTKYIPNVKLNFNKTKDEKNIEKNMKENNLLNTKTIFKKEKFLGLKSVIVEDKNMSIIKRVYN